VAFLPLPASDVAGQSPPTGAVVGTVSESGSSQPVSSALVRVGSSGPSAITNAAGQFRLTGVAPGPLTLEVTALGYGATSLNAAVTAAGETRVAITLEPDPLQVERLIVTADKAARNTLEVAALTSVVDREDAEARGDLELVDALENEVGIVHTAQAGSFESIELRGMPRGGNEFETTLLLVDGVPQTDSRNSARVINLPIDHADAVEIVRGPNSALYGRTAIGGAINVITAQPTAVPRATAQVQAGDFGHRRAALSASGPIEDWAGYFFSWSSTGNDGFYRRDSSYDVHETSVFGKLTFTPDARSHAMLSVNSVTSDNSLPTSVPVVGGEVLSDLEPGFDVLDNINLPTANYHHEEVRLTTSYARELGAWASATNTFAYRDILTAFEESGDIIGAPFDLTANTLTMYPFSLRTDEEVFYEEARLTLAPPFAGLDHEILIGASYERTTGFRLGDLIYTDAATFGMPIDFLNAAPPSRSDWEYFQFGGDEYSLSTLGLYYQYQVSPLSRIQLTAAGRFDRLRLENAETLQTGAPSIDETFEAFSPKFSALVRVLDGSGAGALGALRVNLYATYSQAFKPPRTPSALNPAGTDPPLDPEDIANVEVGVKGATADGRASLDATYFHMRRDGIVVSTRQGPFFVPSNAGRQDFDGVELAAAWAPSSLLELGVSSVFYHNRFGDFVIQTSGGDTDLTGNRLPLVPDRIFNASATLSPMEDVQLTAGFKHVGDRFLDQQNTYRLESYALLDGSVSWSRGPLRVTVSGHNMLDRRYFGNGDTSLAESVEPGAPRQLVLGLAFVHD
jgi:iron complex outermembrane receptor protein